MTTIRVPCCVELDTWHVVSAGRHASQGYLQLDDTLVKGKSGGSHLTHHGRTGLSVMMIQNKIVQGTIFNSPPPHTQESMVFLEFM